jgi:hypothetical protein
VKFPFYSLSLRQAFPLLLFAIAKISKNCPPSKPSPWGEGGQSKALDE